MDHTLEAVITSPEYKKLIAERHRLVWPLLALTVGSYMGFIFVVAFEPTLFGLPFGEGVISYGIVLGLSLILLIFLITFYYVRQANRRIEPLIEKIQQITKEQ